jgi:hypothetical protein
MSQAQQRHPHLNIPPRAGTRQKVDLASTAQFLLFEPGLYAVDFNAARSVQSEIGLRLPCIRLEPLPASHYPGRAFVSFAAEGGWLSSREEAAFVLVVGGQAGLVLTVYRLEGTMPAPEIRIRAVGVPGAPNGVHPGPSGAMAGGVGRGPGAIGEAAGATPLVPLKVLAHVRAVGDVTAPANGWAGTPGSGHPIEGFAATPGSELMAEDLEYQAVLGHNWNTPWFSGGAFCGSRGLALPLLGFRARLAPAAAEHFVLRYWGGFVGSGVVGPVAGGDLCAIGDAPLEALRLEISPLPPQPAAMESSRAVARKAAPKPRASAASARKRPAKGAVE